MRYVFSSSGPFFFGGSYLLPAVVVVGHTDAIRIVHTWKPLSLSLSLTGLYITVLCVCSLLRLQRSSLLSLSRIQVTHGTLGYNYVLLQTYRNALDCVISSARRSSFKKILKSTRKDSYSGRKESFWCSRPSQVPFILLNIWLECVCVYIIDICEKRIHDPGVKEECPSVLSTLLRP
jgi:hypothetical protein